MTRLEEIRSGRQTKNFWEFTPTEVRVLELVALAMGNSEIARELGITRAVVRYHVSNILSKLCVSSRVSAARWAWGNGIITIDEAWAALKPNGPAAPPKLGSAERTLVVSFAPLTREEALVTAQFFMDWADKLAGERS